MKNVVWCSYFLMLLLLAAQSVRGFVQPSAFSISPRVARTQAFTSSSTYRGSALLLFPESSSVILAESEEAVAFNDSIDYFDPSIGLLLGGFGVVALLLFGTKFLADKMDSAIEQVLVDFERTMSEQYPQRWQDMKTSLEGLEGDERQQKVMQLMEDIQKNDPQLMQRINEKMKM